MVTSVLDTQPPKFARKICMYYVLVATILLELNVCQYCFVFIISEYEEDSEEESGKDWDELEEEAREG